MLTVVVLGIAYSSTEFVSEEHDGQSVASMPLSSRKCCCVVAHAVALSSCPGVALSSYLLHALEAVLGDRANLLVTAHTDVPC